MTLDLKDRLYTSSEVAEILGVSLRSVYRYLEEGKLDADIKTATGRHRFSKKNILDFLQPGGITKETSSNSDLSIDNDEEDFDVLDLPAINKSKKETSNNLNDDFSFDLDEDFFKSLDLDSGEDKNKILENNPKHNNGDFIDDDLEKLLKEFEEKEGITKLDSSQNLNYEGNNQDLKNLESKESKNDDDFDFDLDSFFKELEEDSFKNTKENNTSTTQDSSKKNDFDFNFDDLDDLFEEETNNSKNNEIREVEVPKQENKNNLVENDSDEEDNWLERFRKAAMQNSKPEEKVEPQEDKLKSSFFEKSSLDKFFGGESSTNKFESVSSIGFSPVESETKLSKNQEFYYSSSLNGLKEIAQNIDKIAKKFDTDYAFTMNAGLSLHKPISPFTLIHAYVRGRDLELFEDYLNLSKVDSASEASVCLIVPSDSSVFEDSYELHGLYVVSNVQLRSDLIDKGLDKLAREI